MELSGETVVEMVGGDSEWATAPPEKILGHPKLFQNKLKTSEDKKL